jgi:sugar diacid utilization regulator
LERIVLDRFGDRDVLVAMKDGLVVVLALADDAVASGTTSGAGNTTSLGSLLYAELKRLRRGSPWRVAVGRAHPGAYGIARSYEEAREGLTTASRMQLDSPVVESKDIMLYRVLFRDQPAIVDLVHSTLDPLRQARGGARPLLDTLEAYFDSGSVATSAAARLHLSVRAITYRLDRVRKLTGYDPVDPKHRLTLQTAVLGAKLLGWPESELPTNTKLAD